MSFFLALSKNVSPLVNDNDQGPSREPSRKTDTFFIERKDDILPSCEPIFNCFNCFLKYLSNKTPIFKEKIVPQNEIFGPNFLP